MRIIAEIQVRFDEGCTGEEVDARELSDAIAGAISECQGIENDAEVEIKTLKVVWDADNKKRLRCQERNPECGQCELVLGHEGKHLAGYMLWGAIAAEQLKSE